MFGSKSVIRIGKSGNKKVLSRGAKVYATPKSGSANYYSGKAGRETASQMTHAGGGGSGISQFGNERLYVGGVDVNTPYIDDIHHRTLCGMYRDIYFHDPVAGSAVDLMSNLPFSNFKLNVPASKGSEKIAEVFEENLNALRINMMLPPAAREHMVYGWHTSMLIYKKSSNKFTDTMPIPAYDTELVDNILFGRDPILRVIQSRSIQEFLAEKSPTVTSILERLNPEMVSMLRSGNFELDPLSTIYFPRKTFASTDKGESYYRRIIPLYMLEKVLFRGTLTMANRRQTSVMHIVAGDEMWQPQPEEFDQLIEMFQMADRDPLGAAVATRNGVSINEVKNHGDLWKWNEVAPDFDAKKLLALGINEAFLSGDITYNNMEHALSVFMEQLRAFRENAASTIFYNKLFPLISVTHGFTKSQYGELDNDMVTANFRRLNTELDTKMNNMSDYIIPIIEWEKKLMPEGDEELFTIMEKMEEKGVPIPLRTWAAAGGMNLDDMIAQSKSGIKDMQLIGKLKSEMEKVGGEQSEGSDDDGFANYHKASTYVRGAKTPEEALLLPQVGIMNRQFRDSHYEKASYDNGGKKRFVMNQDKAQKAANLQIANTMKRLATTQGVRPKKFFMSARKNETNS